MVIILVQMVDIKMKWVLEKQHVHLNKDFLNLLERRVLFLLNSGVKGGGGYHWIIICNKIYEYKNK